MISLHVSFRLQLRVLYPIGDCIQGETSPVFVCLSHLYFCIIVLDNGTSTFPSDEKQQTSTALRIATNDEMAIVQLKSKAPFVSRLYLMWGLTFVFGIVPYFVDILRPLWRLMCWVLPAFLALDMDAGNDTIFYYAKGTSWVLMQLLAIFILHFTKGFTTPKSPVQKGADSITQMVRSSSMAASSHNSLVRKEWAFPVMVVLFIASCIITVIGNSRRNQLRLGGWPPTPGPQEKYKYIGERSHLSLCSILTLLTLPLRIGISILMCTRIRTLTLTNIHCALLCNLII